MELSQAQLVAIMPECSHVVDRYLVHLNEAFERFEINTPLRVAAFLAQVGHESTRLTRIEENLNYSANGLVRTFPADFTSETAKDFAYKPMKIANRIYANKGGNGDEASGDGWKFRGRGLIQITLQRNYMIRGKRLVQNDRYFLENPDFLILPEWAVRSSADYWDDNSLNDHADINSEAEFRLGTRKINRALRGLDDRLHLWRVAKPILGVTEKELNT